MSRGRRALPRPPASAESRALAATLRASLGAEVTTTGGYLRGTLARVSPSFAYIDIGGGTLRRIMTRCVRVVGEAPAAPPRKGRKVQTGDRVRVIDRRDRRAGRLGTVTREHPHMVDVLVDGEREAALYAPRALARVEPA